MRSPSLLAVVLLALGSAVHAQEDLRARLNPITAPIRHAGVYHVASGTWTRGGSLANAVGPDVVYNNTCAPHYATGMSCSSQRFQHRNRLPSPSSPTSDSVFYGTTNFAHRYDSRPGCREEYTIDGFQVGYCSSHAGTVDWEYGFASSYSVCGAADLVPQSTILVTGLPGGTPAGVQVCWTIDIDVSGLPGGGFALSADGDGTYDGDASDTFGWSMRVPSLVISGETGPIIAGDVSWTGGPTTGPLEPCTGTDGTIWDVPVDLGEAGTGMSSPNFFRISGMPPCPESPGCFFFGGNPHGDFFLKLYADTQCQAKEPPLILFCAPGVAGIVTCPCGNPQVPAGTFRGCNNFVGGGTGGALLRGAGIPSLAADSLVLTTTEEAPATTITVLFQGTTNSVNARTGAGVRCVGGTLKRLYDADASGGAIHFPNDNVPFHVKSAAKGFPINAPVTLYYYAAYRNSAANGQPGCPGFDFGFNATNAGAVSWAP
jgi:hypothetical protein